MKLDNAKRAGKIRLFYMLIPLLVVIAAGVTYLVYDIKDLLYMMYAFIVLVIFFIIMGVFRFNYIIFYAGPDKIRVRFKSLTPFNSPSNSVVIKTEDFHSYQIKTSIGGYKKVLILFQKVPGGLAKYPEIGFSALTGSEIEKIKKALDLTLLINKSKK